MIPNNWKFASFNAKFEFSSITCHIYRANRTTKLSWQYHRHRIYQNTLIELFFAEVMLHSMLILTTFLDPLLVLLSLLPITERLALPPCSNDGRDQHLDIWFSAGSPLPKPTSSSWVELFQAVDDRLYN